MTKQAMNEVLEILKSGKEPFMTNEGWTEFYRILVEEEDAENTNLEKAV